MGRWEPNARGRLAQAAMSLYAEQGFEQTTAAEIARRAGLTERTFFRHFADKREVLFHGTESMQELVLRAVADAPPGATPLDTVGLILRAAGAVLQEAPALARARHQIVSANADLRERDLVKLDQMAAGIAEVLRARGVPVNAASLAAETGIAVFKVACARWASAQGKPGEQDLQDIIGEAMADLRGLLNTGDGSISLNL
jgi:AcrR family transcriptional regulator